MTRKEVRDLALHEVAKSKAVILELPTGHGKTKLAIEMANRICDLTYEKWKEESDILILVDKKVQKKVWLDEIKYWGGLNTSHMELECYASLHKLSGRSFTIVICDEMHHLFSDKRLKLFKDINVEHIIGLSATIDFGMKSYMSETYDAKIISESMRNAIDSGILPDPLVCLIPMELDDTKRNILVTQTRGNHAGRVTQKEYYTQMSNTIDWYKQKFFDTRKESVKNRWLSLCLQRLKWLSRQKEELCLKILKRVSGERTLTFCADIAQCEVLGHHPITSKNSNAMQILQDFNDKKINHITACSMLNESVNLKDCAIGLFCSLHASQKVTIQQCGRLLRTNNPKFIIPYFKNTRESEIMEKMKENYNPEYIRVLDYGHVMEVLK